MAKASVIIRAKNEARFLGETLDAIYAQTERDLEVVLVDSGSTDGTLDIARRYPLKLVAITPAEFTYGYALNLGIREASGEYLLCLSAHSLPADEHWLAAAISGFRDARVAGVFGRQLLRENANVFDYLRNKVSGVLSEKPNRLSKGMGYSNTNGAIRRSVWNDAPFDEQLAGAEDLAWAKTVHRLGYDIVYEPQMAVYHSHNESFGRLLRRLWHDQPVILSVALGMYGTARPQPSRKRIASPSTD